MVEVKELTEELLSEAVSMDEMIFPESPWGRESFLENVRHPFDYPLMAFWNGVPAGFGIYRQIDAGEVLLIGVMKDFRRKGIGSALLDQMLRIADRSQNIFLEVRVSNAPAKALYFSRGFKEIARRKNYYTDPAEDAVIMMG